MILRPAPFDYSQGDQAALRDALRRADAANLKRDEDLEMVRGKRIILTSPGGAQFYLSVDDAGALSTVGV